MVLRRYFRVDRSCPAPRDFEEWNFPLVGCCLLIVACLALQTPSVVLGQGSSSKAKPSARKPKPPKTKPAEPAAEAGKPENKSADAEDKLPFSAAQIANAKSKFKTADEAFGVAASYYNSRNFAASREPFEAALILSGPDVEYRVKVFNALLASYRQLGTTEEFTHASEYIIRHSERDAEQSLTRRALLSFLYERGQLDPFITRHEARLKKNPKDRVSLYLLSELYSRMREDPARAIALIKQLGEVDGKDEGAVDVNLSTQLAMQHIRAKEYQKGAELYEKIAPLNETTAAWNWKEAAQAWLKLKQNDKALAAAKQADAAPIEKRNEQLTHFFHRGMGDVYLATGEPKLAIPHYEQAIATTKIEGYIKDCTASLAEAKKKAGK